MALIISRRSFYCPNFATAPLCGIHLPGTHRDRDRGLGRSVGVRRAGDVRHRIVPWRHDRRTTIRSTTWPRARSRRTAIADRLDRVGSGRISSRCAYRPRPRSGIPVVRRRQYSDHACAVCSIGCANDGRFVRNRSIEYRSCSGARAWCARARDRAGAARAGLGRFGADSDRSRHHASHQTRAYEDRGGGQLMTHPNALLTPRARLRLARLIVEDGYPATIAAKMGSFAGEGEILR